MVDDGKFGLPVVVFAPPPYIFSYLSVQNKFKQENTKIIVLIIISVCNSTVLLKQLSYQYIFSRNSLLWPQTLINWSAGLDIQYS